MQTVRLGRTGLTVSVAALGAGGKSRLGQAQGMSRENSVALVRSALDEGVTLIDTAAVYGTEEIVGEAVQGRRAEIVISTKALVTERFNSPKLIDGAELTRRVDGCLSRLGTDRIDIFHLHGVRDNQYDYCCKELVPVLVRLREAGKIKFIGVTEYFNEDPQHEMLMRAVADKLFDVLMVGFNFVNQTALAHILPEAKRKDMGTLCMFAVRGSLAKVETANALVRTLIATGEIAADAVNPDNPLGFLVQPGVANSLSEAAYRFCRHTPGMDVVMTGTGSADHLRQNLRAIQERPLPAATRERLARIFGNVVSETAEP